MPILDDLVFVRTSSKSYPDREQKLPTIVQSGDYSFQYRPWSAPTESLRPTRSPAAVRFQAASCSWVSIQTGIRILNDLRQGCFGECREILQPAGSAEVGKVFLAIYIKYDLIVHTNGRQDSSVVAMGRSSKGRENTTRISEAAGELGDGFPILNKHLGLDGATDDKLIINALDAKSCRERAEFFAATPYTNG